MIDTLEFRVFNYNPERLSKLGWISAPYKVAGKKVYHYPDTKWEVRIKKSTKKNWLIFDSSIQKSMTGYNYKNYGLKHAAKGVTELCQLLDLNMEGVQIDRIDISAVLDTKFTVRAINQSLVTPKDFSKNSYSNDGTIHYKGTSKNSGREFLFYDKVEELEKNKHVSRPLELKGKNMLRLELRLMEFKKFLKIQRFTLDRLNNPTIRARLLFAWYRTFSSIEFKQEAFIPDKLKAPKDAMVYLSKIALSQVIERDKFFEIVKGATKEATKKATNSRNRIKTWLYELDIPESEVNEIHQHYKMKIHRIAKKHMERI